MKKRYSIGEVAALLGISSQTLRFYSNQGLIEPRYIDEQSGYRYYSYDQFHKIDRIKYLQSLGMSLSEIKEALKSGQVRDLLPFLEKQKETNLREMEAIRKNVERLDWYIDYYKYLDDDHFPAIPFKRAIGPRFLLGADVKQGEALFGPGGLRLTTLKSKAPFKDLVFLRQHGYLLNFEALLKGTIQPEVYFVYLKEAPDFTHEAVREIPAGEFLCFRGRILADEWDHNLAAACFPDSETLRLVVADEYEDNLNDFFHCTYEIQILIKTLPIPPSRQVCP